MSDPAPVISSISPCLWFDGEALEAAKFYTSIFANSAITNTQYYTSAGADFHKRSTSDVLAVSFTLNNQSWTALNGAAGHKAEYTNAVSFQINCADQKEIDYFWEKLGEGGDEEFSRCGWLKDRYGVLWQVVPKDMVAIMGRGGTEEGRTKAMQAMLGMKKLDIKVLEDASMGVSDEKE